jgi:hypothetical protein
MRDYTRAELADATTYETDDELATLARHLATMHFAALGAGRVGRGTLKAEFLAGAHPDIVHAEVQRLAAAKTNQNKALAELQAIALPAGYALTVSDSELLLQGPFDEDLHPRIKRLGGYWDGQGRSDRKCWAIPPEKAASLKRALTNWLKAHPEREARRSAMQASSDRASAERWLGYVEDKARAGQWYDKGEQKLRWELQVARWPDLQHRLDEARRICEQACEANERRAAERWLGWIEEKAATGYRYGNGVSKLHELRVSQRWPDLRERLDQALAVCAQAQAAAAATRPNAESGADRQPAKRKPRRLFVADQRPATGVPVRLGGSVVVIEGFGKEFRISDDVADIENLLGHEGDWACYGYYRHATTDEIAELERREADAAETRRQRSERHAEIRAIRERIKSDGERPDGMHATEGDRLIDSQTIYGGGEWFVVGAVWIWYCANNGHDGDDWSQNNVRTGGAGAIGWRLPRTDELANRLRELDAAEKEGGGELA